MGTTRKDNIIRSNNLVEFDQDPILSPTDGSVFATWGSYQNNIYYNNGSTWTKYDTRPYKVYTARIGQTGTDAPAVELLENTIGIVPIVARTNIGAYTLVFAGYEPDAPKCYLSWTASDFLNGFRFHSMFDIHGGDTTISVYSWDAMLVSSDNAMGGTSPLYLEFRVYS